MVMGRRPLKIFFVAAEPSGDWQAGELARRVVACGVPVELYGVGGPCLEAAGAKLWMNTQGVSCIGPADALGRITYYFYTFYRLQAYMKELCPDITVMLDSPALNLRMAKFLRRESLRSFYYIPPSAWTKDAKRLHQIHALVDGVGCIFSLNASRYRELGLPVAFFGHPIVDLYADNGVSAEEARLRIGAKGRVLAVLPGSRRQEVVNLLPQFTDMAEMILAEDSEAEVFIPCATEPLLAYTKKFLGDSHPRFRVVLGQTRTILQAARLALTASGSATLEATMCGVPMAICYRFGLLNEIIGRILRALGFLQYGHMGLPNLLLNRRAIPEFLQEEVCPELMMPLLLDLWRDTPCREQMIADLKAAQANLGQPGMLEKMAGVVVDMALGKSLVEALGNR